MKRNEGLTKHLKVKKEKKENLNPKSFNIYGVLLMKSLMRSIMFFYYS